MLQRVREDTTTEAAHTGATKSGRKRKSAIEYVAQKQVGYLLRTAFQPDVRAVHGDVETSLRGSGSAAPSATVQARSSPVGRERIR